MVVGNTNVTVEHLKVQFEVKVHSKIKKPPPVALGW
jgi:hypothetical protein